MTASSVGDEGAGGPSVEESEKAGPAPGSACVSEAATKTGEVKGSQNAGAGNRVEKLSNSCPAEPTELVYLTYDGNFELDCEARVTAVSLANREEGYSPDAASLSLDRTVLHPQGGGQPTDWGRITRQDGDGPPLQWEVTDVRIDRATGVVAHCGTCPLPAMGSSSQSPTASFFQPGDTVRVKVQADRRRILSECHTAGHVVDAALARCGLWLKPSKGYHFLDGPYVEYKGSIPAHQRSDLLEQLQTAFRQLVEEDIPTEIQSLDRRDAEELCNREAPTVLFDVDAFATNTPGTNDRVRVVTVAGYPCPCGGTHVRSTGELRGQGWAITGLKCKSQVVRVKYGRTSEATKREC